MAQSGERINRTDEVRGSSPLSSTSAYEKPSVYDPNGAVAQLGERLNGIQEVRGSSPLSSTFFLGNSRTLSPLGERVSSVWWHPEWRFGGCPDVLTCPLPYAMLWPTYRDREKTVTGMSFLTIGVVLLALAGLLGKNGELMSVGRGVR